MAVVRGMRCDKCNHNVIHSLSVLPDEGAASRARGAMVKIADHLPSFIVQMVKVELVSFLRSDEHCQDIICHHGHTTVTGHFINGHFMTGHFSLV